MNFFANILIAVEVFGSIYLLVDLYKRNKEAGLIMTGFVGFLGLIALLKYG